MPARCDAAPGWHEHVHDEENLSVALTGLWLRLW